MEKVYENKEIVIMKNNILLDRKTIRKNEKEAQLYIEENKSFFDKEFKKIDIILKKDNEKEKILSKTPQKNKYNKNVLKKI